MSSAGPTSGSPTPSPRADALAATGLALWLMGTQVSEGLALAGAALTLAGSSLRGGRWWWPGGGPLALALGLYVGWGLLATLLAGPPYASGAIARHLHVLLIPVAAGAALRLSEVHRRRVLLAGAAVLLLSCLMAGLQHLGVWPPLERFEPLAWTRLGFARVYEAVPLAPGRFMAGGLTFHRLKFASITSLGVLIALDVALTGDRRRARLAAGVTACVAFAAVLLFPYARAAAASLVLAVAARALLERRHRRAALVVGAVVVVAAALTVGLVGSVRARLVSASTSSGSGERAGLVRSGLSAARAHPLTGTGLGRFQHREWAAADAPAAVREHGGLAHNQFVSIAAQAGAPGLVAFLLLLAALARAMSPLGLSALAFFASLSMTHDPLFHSETSLALMLAFGLALRPGSARVPAALDRAAQMEATTTADSARSSGATGA